MAHRRYVLAKFVVVVGCVFASAVLYLRPGGAFIESAGALAFVDSVVVAVLPLLYLPWDLLLFVILFVGFAVLRRKRLWRMTKIYALAHVLLLVPAIVQSAVLFHFTTAAAGVAAIVVVGALVWRVAGRDGIATLNVCLNLAVAWCFASHVQPDFVFPSDEQLAKRYGAVRLFPRGAIYDVVADSGYLYITASGDAVYRVPLSGINDGIERTPEGGLTRANWISTIDNWLLVTNSVEPNREGPDVVACRLSDYQERRFIDIPSLSKTSEVAVDPASRRVYLISERIPRLFVWDVDAWSPVASVDLSGGRTVGYSSILFREDTGEVLVTDYFLGGAINVVDGDGLALVRRVPVGPSLAGMALDRKTDRLFVARPLHRRLDVLDAVTYSVVGSIRVAPGTRKVAVLEDLRLLVAGSYFTGELVVMNVDDPARRMTIRAFPRIRTVRYDPAGERLLVCSSRGLFAIPLSAFDFLRVDSR